MKGRNKCMVFEYLFDGFKEEMCEHHIEDAANMAFIYRQWKEDSKKDWSTFFDKADEEVTSHEVNKIKSLLQCLECPDGPSHSSLFKGEIKEVIKKLSHIVSQIEEFDNEKTTKRELCNAYKLISDNIEFIAGWDWRDASTMKEMYEESHKVLQPMYQDRNVSTDDHTIESFLKVFLNEAEEYIEARPYMVKARERVMKMIGDERDVSVEMFLDAVYNTVVLISRYFVGLCSNKEGMKAVEEFLPVLDITLRVLYITAPNCTSYKIIAESVLQMLRDEYGEFREAYESGDTHRKSHFASIILTFITLYKSYRENDPDDFSTMILPSNAMKKLIPIFWTLSYPRDDETIEEEKEEVKEEITSKKDDSDDHDDFFEDVISKLEDIISSIRSFNWTNAPHGECLMKTFETISQMRDIVVELTFEFPPDEFKNSAFISTVMRLTAEENNWFNVCFGDKLSASPNRIDRIYSGLGLIMRVAIDDTMDIVISFYPEMAENLIKEIRNM